MDRFEVKALEWARKQSKGYYMVFGRNMIIGPGYRRDNLKGMYEDGAKSRKKAEFSIWKFLLIIVVVLLLVRLVRLLFIGFL
jgi:hypothetical protein